MDQDKVAHLLGLEEKLAKVRQQINSKLDNQKHFAVILTAVEENINNDDISKNIIAYMVAFMSLLDQAVDQETREIKDLKLASSVCYLLDIIFQYSPKKLLRARFAEILTKLAPCITDENAQAPLIRAAVGCLESLLVAQDAQAWNNTMDLSITPKRGLQGLLQLSLDPRPKVRKRAQDSIHAILANPPPAPTAEHVASISIASFTIKALEDLLQEAAAISNKKLKAQKSDNDLNSRIIRVMRLISAVISTGQWPSSLSEHLCDMLLQVTKSSDQYLVAASFDCFEHLFKIMAVSSVNFGLAESKSLQILDIIFSLTPSNTDTNLVGSWIAVLVKSMTAFSVHEPLECFKKIPDIFKLMSNYLSSETPEVYYSASQCLIAVLTDAVSDSLLLYPPAIDESTFEAVDDVLLHVSETLVDLLSLRYSHCAKEVLNVLAAAFKKFRFRANPDFIRLLEIVGEWRTNEENFLEFREEAEKVIGSAIYAMGPETVLGLLPLNLEEPSDVRPGRAWILPLIRDHTRNTTLSTFIIQLAPSIKSLESRLESLPEESIQRKVLQTVVDQIWSTLPHFCELPTDLVESFTDEFASELASLLYSKVALRTTICHALKMLVESNSAYVNGGLGDNLLLAQSYPIEKAQKSLEYLSAKAGNILAVLFNVYTQTAPNARGYILETIEEYLKITSQTDMEKTFNNICGLLKNAMDEETNVPKKGKPQLSATLLDLVVCMTKYVPSTSHPALFSIFGTTVQSKDALTQKRAYRIIIRLSELESGAEALSSYLSDIEEIMVQNTETVQTASRSARLAAIKTITELLPADRLSFIVRTVAEVILSTKDVNEKSREGGFETLIAMGKKMNDPHGVIKLSKISGYDPEIPDQPSSMSEFFKIIAAGLIGESQHMVSSTITAFACLVFEFKSEVDATTLVDIYDTIELYLTTNSKEIAKSAIGFVKVCVLGLSDDLMRPKVPELLPKLLRWSHEHTGHFKSKVKNIIERMVRKFGYEFIEANFPQDDIKLLANIRKVRNRNKRKEAEEEVSGVAAVSTKGSRFMNAFDEAIYESSDNENENDEETQQDKGKKSKQFIVESSGNPLDLLDSQTLAHISSTRPKKFTKDQRKKQLQDDMFNFDSEGKLIMKGQPDSSIDDDPLKSVTSGINAYLEAVKHGPIRGQKNRLKFKKDARAGADNSDEEDDKLPKSASLHRNKITKGRKMGPKFKSRRKL